EGPTFVVGEGPKFRIALLFRDKDYWSEDFLFDGSKTEVGYRIPGTRSNLEAFFNANGEVLREGLFGGVLTTAWPFLDASVHGAKLEYDGLKKLNGKEVHQVSYQLKKGQKG